MVLKKLGKIRGNQKTKWGRFSPKSFRKVRFLTFWTPKTPKMEKIPLRGYFPPVGGKNFEFFFAAWGGSAAPPPPLRECRGARDPGGVQGPQGGPTHPAGRGTRVPPGAPGARGDRARPDPRSPGSPGPPGRSKLL